jgi:hypothetical protein
MIQYILTIFIVCLAMGIALYKLYTSLKKPEDACNGCASKGCDGCGVADLKREIEEKRQKRNQIL